MLLQDIKTTRYATMDKTNVFEFQGREPIADPLTELLRTGAERLIYQVVEAEVQELLAAHSGRLLEDGHAAVVRTMQKRQVRTR